MAAKKSAPPEIKNFHKTGYLAGHSGSCPASNTRAKQEAFTTMSVTTAIPKGSRRMAALVAMLSDEINNPNGLREW
jgi:hypothetical protein